MTTPNLSLPELAPSQAQPHLTLNSALRRLDAAVQLSVISISNTPPGSPFDGDRYIVGTSPTGAWVGHNNEIAAYVGTSWIYLEPESGWMAFVRALGVPYLFGQGSPPAWEEMVAQNTGALSGAALRRTTDQSLSNFAWTAISWTTEDFDDGAYFDSGQPTRLTIAETGLYSASFNMRFLLTSTSGDMSISINKNGIPGGGGTTGLAACYLTPGIGTPAMSASWIGKLTAGDYLVAAVYSGKSGDSMAGVGPNNFAVCRLR